MQIDATTLNDLEILAGRGGEGGILQLVDHTRTRAGRAALRRRLASPLTGVEEIVAVQEALEALDGQVSPLPLDDDLLAAAEQHVRSKIVMGSHRPLRVRIQELWMRLRYADIHRELRQGVTSVLRLRDVAAHLGAGISRLEGGPLLRQLGRELSEASARITEAAGQGSVLAVDRRLREACRDDVLRIIEILGDLDALQSMATAGNRPGWTRPELVAGDEFLLEADGAVHPFVPEATPNPVRLTGGEPLVFLTGPNMAGKTTYLRTVGVLVVLAQTGMKVPAAAMRLAPVEAVLTSLNPVDNLRAGVSYFYAEVLRVREAAGLLAAGRSALILFDEVFKGTNVRDALDASTEVIRGFARSRRSGSIFSSHLSELADRLGEGDAVRFCRFDGEIRDGHAVFTFRLEPGVSDTRFGMLLLQEARVPELIARIGT